MSLTQSLAPHIPYLRRFARALTGSQQSGDAYAVATLQAMAEAEEEQLHGLEGRQALFRVFMTIWGSLPVNHRAVSESATPMMGAADRSLEAVTPLPRAVFLLRSLEGFKIGEIAELLDKRPKEIQDLLDAAGREIAQQLRAEVLIIEDEPVISMDLEALMLDLGHTVLPPVRTRREALAALAENTPGLILADIQLADGSSGLDAVKEILMSHEVPVVFITAYPERLLTGARPEPTFLITKPFQPDTVRAIISQALFFDRRASLAPQLQDR